MASGHHSQSHDQPCNPAYPSILEDCASRQRPLRDLIMMRMINSITDKPNWTDKIQDQGITSRWRKEFLESGEDVAESMMERVLDELNYVASLPQDQPFRIAPSYIAVYKTDDAIHAGVKTALQNEIVSLEAVPSHLKDWHPGSDEKVQDLVHPSLFPLIVGRTRVLPDQESDLQACMKMSGSGSVVDERFVPKIPSFTPVPSRGRLPRSALPVSNKFQWLPSEVRLSRDHEGNVQTKFTSYINNLHPTTHANLYSIIESILARCVPLWDLVLGETEEEYSRCRCQDKYFRDERGSPPIISSLRCEDIKPYEWYDPDESSYSSFASELDADECYENRKPLQPEAAPFVPPEPKPTHTDLSSRSTFQVIVKLATVHLSPDGKETYPGGSWHVEGQINERIAATAIYYFSCNNVTPSSLSFRANTHEIPFYDQGDYTGPPHIFGIGNGDPLLQELGSVQTREDRILAFPNMLQHRVSGFQLQDKSKPGWRKILAFFLIDPRQRIISTASVPPQQRHWWAEMVREIPMFARLPREVFDQITDNVDFPYSLDDAKEERVELMDERSVMLDIEEHLKDSFFSLCEH